MEFQFFRNFISRGLAATSKSRLSVSLVWGENHFVATCGGGSNQLQGIRVVTSSSPTTEQKLYTLSYFNLECTLHLCMKLIYGRKPWSSLSSDREHVRCLKRFDELRVWLQTENPSEVKMSKVRFYFDKLLTEYPTLRRYLGKDSDLVHSPNFDNAISKIQLAADQG